MKTLLNNSLECSIVGLDEQNFVVMYDGRAIERQRTCLLLKLPNGHTVSAPLSRTDLHKVQDALGTENRPLAQED